MGLGQRLCTIIGNRVQFGTQDNPIHTVLQQKYSRKAPTILVGQQHHHTTRGQYLTKHSHLKHSHVTVGRANTGTGSTKGVIERLEVKGFYCFSIV